MHLFISMEVVFIVTLDAYHSFIAKVVKSSNMLGNYHHNS